MSSTNKPARLKQSPQVIAQAIRQLRVENQNAAVIVVEGQPDQRCYKRIINQKRGKIKPFGEKTSILEAISLLKRSKHNNGVISITDLDYDQILSVNSEHIQTDYVDLEMYGLWDAKKRFQISADEWIVPDKLESCALEVENIIDIAIQRASDLGSIRLYNEINPLGIDFKPFKFRKVAPDALQTIEDITGLDGVFGLVVKHNDSILMRERDKHFSAVQDIRRKRTPKDLCKGHDFADAFCAVSECFSLLNRNAKSVPISELIEQDLRKEISYELLKKTNLFVKLSDWSDKNWADLLV